MMVNAQLHQSLIMIILEAYAEDQRLCCVEQWLLVRHLKLTRHAQVSMVNVVVITGQDRYLG